MDERVFYDDAAAAAAAVVGSDGGWRREHLAAGSDGWVEKKYEVQRLDGVQAMAAVGDCTLECVVYYTQQGKTTLPDPLQRRPGYVQLLYILACEDPCRLAWRREPWSQELQPVPESTKIIHFLMHLF